MQVKCHTGQDTFCGVAETGFVVSSCYMELFNKSTLFSNKKFVSVFPDWRKSLSNPQEHQMLSRLGMNQPHHTCLIVIPGFPGIP